MKVLDHSHGAWAGRYGRLNRTNGAFTYSRDICRWHVPVWRRFLGPDDTIATCGMIPGATVQYLHERTHPDLSSKTRLFVTTYKDLADALGPRGLWLPNLIDRDALPAHRPRKDWVYFGNVIGAKERGIKHIRARGIDIISGVRDQADALRHVARYRYGIGVGRCALEMMAIGLKVMIFGKDFGGLILSDGDFVRQREANFNGNAITGVGDMATAMTRIGDAVSGPVSFQEAMPEIERRISEVAARLAG